MRININAMRIRIKDPIIKDLRRSFISARCQAVHRDQSWLLEFDQFCDLWLEDEKYKNRGRAANSYHLRRKQVDQPWCETNVEIVKRGQHLRDLMVEKNQRVRRRL